MGFIQAVELSNFIVRKACHDLGGFVSGESAGTGVGIAAKNERALGVVALHIAETSLPNGSSELENMAAVNIRQRVLKLVKLLVDVIRAAVALIGNLLCTAADQNLASQQRGRIRSRNSNLRTKPLIDIRRIVAVHRAEIAEAEFVHQIRPNGARISRRDSSRMVDIVSRSETRGIVRPETVGNREIILRIAVTEEDLVLLRSVEIDSNIEIVEIADLLPVRDVIVD